MSAPVIGVEDLCRWTGPRDGNCGKPAKWLTAMGLKVCAKHRNSANKFHKAEKYPGLACTPLTDEQESPHG